MNYSSGFENENANDLKPSTKETATIFQTGFLADVYNENPIGQNRVEKIVTRFPPEPNGYLHLGHSKAIVINFGFAQYHGGECLLRFDDTNPMVEEEKYFTAIRDMIEWLGFQPSRITHSSDNFDRLYELAEDLIHRGGAYVCHCTKAEVAAQRGEGRGKDRHACSHRERPISESLTEFRAMRDGKYRPQEAVLRMKQNLEDGNPQMWDLAAYRVVDAGHHFRSGDKWKIYPTYDFTHCLCDSFEGITHSLCTTEFELSRVSYEWLCDRLEVYKPMQREFGRLKVSGTVLSKRKIINLIESGFVRDWDDPRLYTLIALKRRGIPPGAILAFVNELGVTKAETTVDIRRFEQCVRRFLETKVPRLMVVLDPIRVVIENLPDEYLEMIELPFSRDPALGVHSVPFTKMVYIDRSDFREHASKDFFRLVPGSSVGLMKVPFPITAVGFEKDEETGMITLIKARYEMPNEGAPFRKPRTYIHWIAECPELGSPIKAAARLFNPLFTSENPDSHPDGFLGCINPASEEVCPNALIEIGFNELSSRAPWPSERSGSKPGPPGPESIRFQGMRVAYFSVDKDSTDDEIVLNRIVSLKEDTKKG